MEPEVWDVGVESDGGGGAPTFLTWDLGGWCGHSRSWEAQVEERAAELKNAVRSCGPRGAAWRRARGHVDRP